MTGRPAVVQKPSMVAQFRRSHSRGGAALGRVRTSSATGCPRSRRSEVVAPAGSRGSQAGSTPRVASPTSNSEATATAAGSRPRASGFPISVLVAAGDPRHHLGARGVRVRCGQPSRAAGQAPLPKRCAPELDEVRIALAVLHDRVEGAGTDAQAMSRLRVRSTPPCAPRTTNSCRCSRRSACRASAP